MSTAIDFNMAFTREDERRDTLTTKQKQRLLPQVYTNEKTRRSTEGYETNMSDYQNMKFDKAFEATHDDEEPKTHRNYEVYFKKIDLFSAAISAICVLVSLAMLTLNSSKYSFSKQAMQVNQDMLLYTRNHKLTNAMRHFHSAVNGFCPAHFDMTVQRPPWNDQSGIAMVSNTHFATVWPWLMVLWIFSCSALFQFGRYRERTQPHGLYKPWRGPEFSRWLEYLFTSPLQIVLVSLSFGFGSLDVLLGHFGMQGALVLLGYSIEQQVKKVYTRRIENAPPTHQYDKTGVLLGVSLDERLTHGPTRMHHYLWTLGVKDLRLPVYLGFAWMLHFLIWGFPKLMCISGSCLWLNWGVGGLYQRQYDVNEECEKDSGFRIPWFVHFLFWSQYAYFSAFGVACTAQVVQAFATPALDRTQMRERARQSWVLYSNIYAFLSITAKTFLEIGFLGLATNWRTWQTEPVHVLVAGNTTFGNASRECWSVLPPTQRI